MAPMYIHISAGEIATPATLWLAYDGTLNGDSIEIADAADDPGVNDDNYIMTAYFDQTIEIALIKSGDHLLLVDNTFNIDDSFDLKWANREEQNFVNFYKETGGTYWLVAASEIPIIDDVVVFDLREFSISGTTLVNDSSQALWSDGLNAPAFDSRVDAMQTVVFDEGINKKMIVYYIGAGVDDGVIVDDFTNVPDVRASGSASNFLGGRIDKNPYSPAVTSGSGRGIVRLLQSPGTDQIVSASFISDPNDAFRDDIVVWVQERVNDVFGGGFPGVDGFRTVGAYLDLTSYLFDGGLNGASSDLVPDVVKVGTNLYIAMNRKAAVIFSVDTIGGGGTVIDSIDFSTDIFNSGGALSTSGSDRPPGVVFPPQQDGNLIEVVGQFDKSNDLGAIPYRYFNATARFDIGANSFTGVSDEVETDQNVSVGPNYTDQIFGAMTSTQIWSFWQVTSAPDYLVNGLKVNR